MLFRHLAAGVSGYFLLPGLAGLDDTTIARAAPVSKAFGSAKQVIFIMLAGAPSHVDTFDFKEGPWTPRSFAPESYNNGEIRFPRGLMPNLAGRLEDLALLRSVRSSAVVHGLSNQWIQLARSPISSAARIAPHIGAVVSREFSQRGQQQTAALPAFFSLNATGGPGAGFLGAEHGPIFLQPSGGGLSPETPYMDREMYARRRQLLERLLQAGKQQYDGAPAEAALFQASGRDILFNTRVDSLFRFSSGEARRYGASAFGNACVIARNLVSANLGVRYIEITFPGWDNHGGIYEALPQLANALDGGLASLLTDLRENGKLDETLVIAMGEFGRTVGPLNSLNGRDHYPQQSVVAAGAGIKGNRAIGATDETGAFTAEPGWSANRSIKAEDVAATIYSALGIDWTTVVETASGARYEYVPIVEDNPYQPVAELWD